MNNDNQQQYYLAHQIETIIAQISNINTQINIKSQQHLFRGKTFFNHCIAKNPTDYAISAYYKENPRTLGMELINKLDSYLVQHMHSIDKDGISKQEQRYITLASIIGITNAKEFLQKYFIMLPENTIRQPITPKIKH